MDITDVATLVDQVQGWPIVILVCRPRFAVVVLRHGVRNIQINNSLFQVTQVRFVGKLRIVIADDDQALIFVFVVPFPQRGNYVPTVNSSKGPHVDGDNFTA